MYITLDIGNTLIKFATFSHEGEMLDWGQLDQAYHLGRTFESATALGFCNVRGQRVPDFGGFTGAIMELAPGIRLPFENDYKTPNTLGTDRLAAAAGAVHRFPGKNVMVLDAGTCLKTEIITAGGHYLGGSISPGMMMRYAALHHYTGRLPEVEHKDFDALIGQSTEESILCGVQAGMVAEATGRIAQLEPGFDDLHVVITGGDGPMLAGKLKTRIFAEPLLHHYGIFHCLRLNGF
ncbi:MAG: type III pantothenate kinase [Bacteroidetes bacterium]|nr:type III pantothenate kinase [Bacteroidota bacterium]